MGHKSCVQPLLDKGANSDFQNKNGITALMMASRSDRKNIAQILLENGSDPEIKTKYGNTAFNFARTDEMREILLQGGLPGPKRAEKKTRK